MVPWYLAPEVCYLFYLEGGSEYVDGASEWCVEREVGRGVCGDLYGSGVGEDEDGWGPGYLGAGESSCRQRFGMCGITDSAVS